MRYLSVCSGIEAATVAWGPLGWKAQAFAEVEKFPSEVLKFHYPETPNYGDITKFKEWPRADIDILVGGTPCQSFSVAGLRKGLDDPRGNLALVYLATAERFRPRWILWENVPGVLSSYTGGTPPSDLEEGQEWETEETSDFWCFLQGLSELGYGWAYRILDAQYTGVPQQRRRVFVVGYLGDWRRAAAVLFERHSLQRHSPPSRKAGERVAACISQSLNTGGIGMSNQELFSQGGANLTWKGDISTNRRTALGEYTDDDLAPTVKARDYKDATDLICCVQQEPVCFTQNDAARDARTNVSPTLRSGSNGGAVNQCVAFNSNARPDEMSFSKVVNGLTASQNASLFNNNQVRRLTPVECERLQGFPDNYTRISWRGKPASQCPDGHRYKALGNSMAVPVMRWIGERIQSVENILWDLL